MLKDTLPVFCSSLKDEGNPEVSECHHDNSDGTNNNNNRHKVNRLASHTLHVSVTFSLIWVTVCEVTPATMNKCVIGCF